MKGLTKGCLCCSKMFRPEVLIQRSEAGLLCGHTMSSQSRKKLATLSSMLPRMRATPSYSGIQSFSWRTRSGFSALALSARAFASFSAFSLSRYLASTDIRSLLERHSLHLTGICLSPCRSTRHRLRRQLWENASKFKRRSQLTLRYSSTVRFSYCAQGSGRSQLGRAEFAMAWICGAVLIVVMEKDVMPLILFVLVVIRWISCRMFLGNVGVGFWTDCDLNIQASQQQTNTRQSFLPYFFQFLPILCKGYWRTSREIRHWTYLQASVRPRAPVLPRLVVHFTQFHFQ